MLTPAIGDRSDVVCPPVAERETLAVAAELASGSPGTVSVVNTVLSKMRLDEGTSALTVRLKAGAAVTDWPRGCESSSPSQERCSLSAYLLQFLAR